MSITITDPALLAQFTAVPGVVEIRHPDGRVLGTFFVPGYGMPPPGVKSPISDEEFEEARNRQTAAPHSPSCSSDWRVEKQ